MGDFIAVAGYHNLTEMESIGIFSGSVWACAGLAEAYAAGPTLKSFEMLGRPGKIICKTIDWGVMVVVAIFKILAQTYQRQENREQYQTMPHLKVSKLIILTKWGRPLFEFWTLSKDTQSLICNLTAKLSKQHDNNTFVSTENSPQRAQQAWRSWRRSWRHASHCSEVGWRLSG